MEISHGEPSRREIRSEKHTRPGPARPSGTLSPELPGAMRSGEVYRQRLVFFQMSSTTLSLHPPGAPASKTLCSERRPDGTHINGRAFGVEASA